MVQVTESDYKTAQQGNAKVRQEFLDAIDFGRAREFIGKVTYHEGENNPMQFHFNSYYSFLLPIYSHLNFHSNRNISVWSNAFKEFGFNCFLSGLIKHEGLHAEQFVRRYEIMKKTVHGAFGGFTNPNIWRSIVEIPAYANMEVGEKDFTELERDRLRTDTQVYSRAFKVGYKLDERKKLMDALLVGSPGDDIVRARYGL